MADIKSHGVALAGKSHLAALAAAGSHYTPPALAPNIFDGVILLNSPASRERQERASRDRRLLPLSLEAAQARWCHP
jgi:hypothetical protein